jgi:hypothetical protein
MIDHETNHLQRMLELLPLQYQGRPNWEGLLVGFWAPQIQRLEDAIDDLAGQMPVGTATGAWLDRWGQQLQLPRMLGQADSSYRPMLLARAAQLRANGGLESIVLVAAFAGQVNVVETPPAALSCYFSALPRAAREQIAVCLQSARPAGVDLRVVATDPDGSGFGAEILPTDHRAMVDSRIAGYFTIPLVPWFLDDLTGGAVRVDMMGDTLL